MRPILFTHDYTISPPKSVSIIALLQDERIVKAHARAIRVACQELERFAQTRVRIGEKDGERTTANLITALFRHDTSRELDPHLHTHCIIFNATFDPVEDRWKALQTHGMLRAQKFVSSVYDHELCRELHAMGYRIRPKGRSFEVDGVPELAIRRFSKRSQQIDAEAAQAAAKGEAPANQADLRDQIAHDHRRRKIKGATADRLRRSWFSELSPRERRALQAIRPAGVCASGPAADVRSLLDWGERHVYERKAVAARHELFAAALTRGRGEAFGLEALREELGRMPSLVSLDQDQVTSRELVRLEAELVAVARKTTRTEGAFNAAFTPDSGLSAEQRRAVTKILESYALITLFRGPAGAGKSLTLREVRRGLVAANRPVVVLAPQRQQVLDLERDGLPAQTLARALADGSVPPRAAILLDEASQVGIRDLSRLTELARKANARLILSGDTRQHGAVAASDALVLLERYAGLPVAKLRTIRRQDPSLVPSREEKRAVAQYRLAVKLASRGKAASRSTSSTPWDGSTSTAPKRAGRSSPAITSRRSTGRNVLWLWPRPGTRWTP